MKKKPKKKFVFYQYQTDLFAPPPDRRIEFLRKIDRKLGLIIGMAMGKIKPFVITF